MQLFKLSISTRCLATSLKQALPIAAESGVQGVQIDVREELKQSDLSETGRRQFLHRLSEIGLKVAAVQFPIRRSLTDQQELDARVTALKAAMQFAWDLQCPILSSRIGKIPADPESAEYRLLREVLDDLARHGNHVGVTLSITPTLDTADRLQTLISSIKTGPIGIDFDPGAFVSAGQNPSNALRTLHPLVTHFEARDAIRDIDGSGLEVALGRGETDWVELLALMHEAEYRGWINVNRTQGDDKGGDALRAVEYLGNVFF